MSISNTLVICRSREYVVIRLSTIKAEIGNRNVKNFGVLRWCLVIGPTTYSCYRYTDSFIGLSALGNQCVDKKKIENIKQRPICSWQSAHCLKKIENERYRTTAYLLWAISEMFTFPHYYEPDL